MPTQSFMGTTSGNLTHSSQRITGKLLATHGYVVGIEISGSGLRQTVALADLDGNILQRTRRPMESVHDAESVIALLEEMLAEVATPERLKEGRILRVGVAVGGLVDSGRGVVRMLHHAQGWNDFPLQEYLEEKLDIPCIIDNNANAAALAEVLYGAGKAERVCFYVGLGRGIGGGLVVNGSIYHGATCAAGEIGHMLVQEDGPQCSCGGFGHLEAVASTEAITRAMSELAVEYAGTEAAMRRMRGSQTETITVEQVFRLAAEGDMVAKGIVENVHKHLGMALANIVHLVNPGVIIVGGQMAQVGDLLIEPLQRRLRALCLPAAVEPLRVVQGRLGLEANIIGAVTLALQDV